MERRDREDVQPSHGQFGGPWSEAQQAFWVGGLAALQAGQVTAAAEQIHVKPLQVLLPQEDLTEKKRWTCDYTTRNVWKAMNTAGYQVVSRGGRCGSAGAVCGERLLSSNPLLPWEAKHTSYWTRVVICSWITVLKILDWEYQCGNKCTDSKVFTSMSNSGQTTSKPPLVWLIATYTPTKSSQCLSILRKKANVFSEDGKQFAQLNCLVFFFFF